MSNKLLPYHTIGSGHFSRYRIEIGKLSNIQIAIVILRHS